MLRIVEGKFEEEGKALQSRQGPSLPVLVEDEEERFFDASSGLEESGSVFINFIIHCIHDSHAHSLTTTAAALESVNHHVIRAFYFEDGDAENPLISVPLIFIFDVEVRFKSIQM